MATKKCGCTTVSCNCILQSSDDTVEITGSGAPANPYDLSIADSSLEGRLLAEDTSTVDLEITGSGSESDPWVLTADATMNLGDLVNVDTSDTSTGYVLARNASGDFEMQPPSTATPGTIMSDASIDGDGSAGAPLAVHDYDRVAWLEGADNLPNVGNLRLGSTGELSDYAFEIARHTGTGVGEDDYLARFRLSRFQQSGGSSQGAVFLDVRNENNLDRSTFRFGLDGRVEKSRQLDTGGGSSEIITWRDPWQIWSIRTCVDGDGSDRASTIVTFPADMFTDLPTVTVTLNNMFTSSGLYACRVQSLTTDDCEVMLQRVDGGTFASTHCLGVQVMQMDPA